MFNTIMYVKKLEEVGVSRQQAETQALLLTEILEAHIATKRDLKELEYSLIIKLGTIVTATAAIVVAAIAILVKSA